MGVRVRAYHILGSASHVHEPLRQHEKHTVMRVRACTCGQVFERDTVYCGNAGQPAFFVLSLAFYLKEILIRLFAVEKEFEKESLHISDEDPSELSCHRVISSMIC